MARYLYNYQTIIRFSQAVGRHQLLLRCLPLTNGSQQIVTEHLVIAPYYNIKEDRDTWGNRILWGETSHEHASLSYVSTGIVEVLSQSSYPDGNERFFAYPTHLTEPNAALRELATSLNDKDDLPMAICETVHRSLVYEQHVTDTTTTAAEALRLGQGVCQDYAHFMITLCRLRGLKARYACGFYVGETGETHAWVEVYDGQRWEAYDPTRGTRAETGYVKLAHGRDAADCPVSRGVYRGTAEQKTFVNVSLEEI